MSTKHKPTVTKHGPVRQYKSRSVYEYIESGGERWNFDRLAVVGHDGSVDLEQLRPDEVVIAPGVIYRRVGR
jgi:hypothetical protein